MDGFEHFQTHSGKTLVDSHFGFLILHVNRYYDNAKVDITIPADVF